MSDMKTFPMACHQAVSFHPAMLRIPKSEVIFWPGCALMNLDGRILERTMAVLRRAEPEIKLATGCCGQPSQFLFPQKTGKRTETLADTLRRQGVKRICTACPNCALQLRKLEGFSIIPIWTLLAEHLRADDVEDTLGRYIWHDPCPTKTEPDQLAAARKLLAISGCDYVEPVHTGTNTICCGNLHMMEFSAPEKSEAMRRRRLAELDGDRTILSSCEGCLSAFRAEGRDTCHLLELLFGRSRRRGWANRILTTNKAPIR